MRVPSRRLDQSKSSDLSTLCSMESILVGANLQHMSHVFDFTTLANVCSLSLFFFLMLFLSNK